MIYSYFLITNKVLKTLTGTYSKWAFLNFGFPWQYIKSLIHPSGLFAATRDPPILEARLCGTCLC